MNDYMLIQEFLKGEEFIVDAITKDGKHIFAEHVRSLRTYRSDGVIVKNIGYNLDLYTESAQRMFK